MGADYIVYASFIYRADEAAEARDEIILIRNLPNRWPRRWRCTVWPSMPSVLNHHVAHYYKSSALPYRLRYVVVISERGRNICLCTLPFDILAM